MMMFDFRWGKRMAEPTRASYLKSSLGTRRDRGARTGQHSTAQHRTDGSGRVMSTKDRE